MISTNWVGLRYFSSSTIEQTFDCDYIYWNKIFSVYFCVHKISFFGKLASLEYPELVGFYNINRYPFNPNVEEIVQLIIRKFTFLENNSIYVKDDLIKLRKMASVVPVDSSIKYSILEIYKGYDG